MAGQGPGDLVDGGSEYFGLVGAADSSAKSRIPISAQFVTVDRNTNGTTDWIVLPTGVPVGWFVYGYSVVAHNIRTEASSNVKINDVYGDGTAQAAITATWNWQAIYHGATVGWVLKAWTKLAAPTTAIVPA